MSDEAFAGEPLDPYAQKDEITRLRAENERLREVLRPIIAEARSVIDDLRTKPDHHNFLIAVTAYDLRAALEGVMKPPR